MGCISLFFPLTFSCPQFQDQPDPFSEEHGLIYRAFVHLFDRLKEKQAKSDCTYVIKASFLEIYNEKVGKGLFLFFFLLLRPSGRRRPYILLLPLYYSNGRLRDRIECKG